MKTKLVPFDIEKAKNGAKVVTRCGQPVRIVKIYDVKNKRYPLIADIIYGQEESIQRTFTKEGKVIFNSKVDNDSDLFIEEEIENNSKNENKNMKTKLIPFDLAKAKAGAKIVTRSGSPIRIVCDNVISEVEGFNLLVLQRLENGKEHPYLCRKNGKASLRHGESEGDLFIEEEGVTQLKKQGKQKPINNIEPFKVISSNIKPKFKVGDYIVNDSVNMKGKIVKLTDHSYQFSSGQCIPFEDNRTRLWDVAKDAKPGDVLAGEYGTILIFKQMDDNEFWFSSYYNTNHKRDCDWDKDCFIPATKEQCDTLFHKMKEEGYEWDSSKKELKLKTIKKEAIGKVKKEVKTRRMTQQELSWWLREHPEEHREYSYKDGKKAYFNYFYPFANAKAEVEDDLLIRKNGGEWQEPLIEIK